MMFAANSRVSKLALLGIAFFVLQGCATSESANIATAEIHPYYELTGASGQVACKATFRVGGALGTYLKLTGGDTATCSDGTTTVTLTKSELLGMVSYEGSGLSHTVGGNYTFTFSRTDKGESFASTVTLPAAVGTVIATPNTVGKSSGTTLSWSGSGSGNVDILVSYNTSNAAGSFNITSCPDTNSCVIGSGDLTNLPDGNSTGKFRVSRSQSGTQASGLSGRGSITATQSGDVAVTFVP